MRLVPGRGGLCCPRSWDWARTRTRWRWRLSPSNCPTASIAWARCRIFCGGARRAGLAAGALHLRPLQEAEKAQREARPARTAWTAKKFRASPQGVMLARDLVNTPPNDMGPAELAEAARTLAKTHGAKFRTVSGAVLARDYPLIAAVGQGSDARAAPDRADLGRRQGAQGDLGGQRRLFRYRRLQSQAHLRHGDDEEGHGRRRRGAGPGTAW